MISERCTVREDVFRVLLEQVIAPQLTKPLEGNHETSIRKPRIRACGSVVEIVSLFERIPRAIGTYHP